jgi:hypothetical protein
MTQCSNTTIFFLSFFFFETQNKIRAELLMQKECSKKNPSTNCYEEYFFFTKK